MKKLLAIILSLVCLFSCATLPASAAGAGVFGELASDFFADLFGVEFEEDTSITYGIIYENDSLSGVSIVYKPNQTISFESSGLYTITSDTPLSIDHEFVCWEDSKGNRYYAGDKLYVEGTITLYAVWVEKSDNDVRVVRILKTTIEAFRRLIGTFLGFFEIIVEFDANYVPTDPTAPRYYDIKINESLYENTEAGKERVLFYLDSLTFYDYGMERVTLDGTQKAEIYFCTGWNEVTREPENKSDVYKCDYSFSGLQGPDRSDIVIISTYSGSAEIAQTYAASLPEGTDTYYMIVTVGDTLYFSGKTESKPYDEFTNPITCIFTLTK